MGDYATTTSISELMPNYLSGNTTTSDAGGANRFSRHIDRAESIVKTYVGARYDVSAFRVGTTTTNVPPVLRTLSEDVACWFAARAAYAQDGELKQAYLSEFERAVGMLEGIRDGKTGLLYTDGSEVPPVASSRFISSTANYSHVFNLDDPDQWAIDDDQVDDMSDARS